MGTQYVYDFSEGGGLGRELLGGKGVGLAEMTAIGLPVPAGFTVTTEACREYMRLGGRVPEGLDAEVDGAVARLEEATGKRFGDPVDPLLVSVRSGAAISMPGMMDTILNLGLNDEAVEGLARATGNERFAFDAYRRLVQMFGEVVGGVEGQLFEQELASRKAERGVTQDVELGAEDLRELVGRFKALYPDFPLDARDQLERSIRAVFDSWDTPRAQVYRRANGIPDDLGTAVNVVQMVFGNKGDDSVTGVAFTRDPSTGEPALWGEFLVNAQGEDVVAGIRTPEPIAVMRERFPEAFEQLAATMARLEEHYREMQDIEFTVEEGTLYLLQTRTGKRTAAAALRIAVDMVAEGLVTQEEAVVRVDPGQLDQLLHPMIDPDAEYEVVARGLNASPGAATGKVVLDGELDVLHVAVVLLEAADVLDELGKRLGEGIAHRLERLRRADAGDDVLALGVREELAEDPGLAGRRIACERDPGPGAVAFVPEHHLHDVDGRPEVVGDVVRAAVHLRTWRVP